MIDLRRLRYFVAVAEEEHFGRAADRLGISQPPLSEHVQALEKSVGAKLFFRTTRSVRLTVQGEALLKHARGILRNADLCREIVNDAGQHDKHSLTIGMLHAHTYTILPALLRAYVAQHPARRIHLVEYSTTEQVAKLLSGVIDIGLVREPLYHASLRTRSLFSEPYALALPEAWALAKADVVSVTALDGLSMIGYPSHDHQRSTQSLFRDFFHRYKVQPADLCEVQTMHAGLALVAANRGFAPVPLSQMALRLNGVAYRRLLEAPPMLSVGLAWREDKASEAVLEFADVCTMHFGTGAIDMPARRPTGKDAL